MGIICESFFFSFFSTFFQLFFNFFSIFFQFFFNVAGSENPRTPSSQCCLTPASGRVPSDCGLVAARRASLCARQHCDDGVRGPFPLLGIFRTSNIVMGEARGFLGSLWEASGKPLGSFWEAPGKLLGRFWEASGELFGRFFGPLF